MTKQTCGTTVAIQYSRKRYLFVVLVAVLSSLVFASDVARGGVYYVDVDSLGGPSSDSNPGTINQPFRTISRARDVIRASGTDGHTVYIRGGIYRLTSALSFDGRDSGSAGQPNVYLSYPGEQPVISGGQVLTAPWTVHSGSIWRCDVGAQRFKSLWVDGQRAQRSREPDEDPATTYLDYYVTSVGSGSDGFIYNGTDINPAWTNLNQVEVMYLHEWKCPRMLISSVDTANKDVTFTDSAGLTYYGNNRYWVENLFEGLDRPGEWYLNASTGILYYYPVGGKNPNTSEVIYPVVGGTTAGFSGRLLNAFQCDYVEFHGLTFEHTDWWLSPEGYKGWQAASALEWHDDDIWTGTGPALCFLDCEHCVVQDGQIRRVGGNGIVLGGNAIKIEHNTFSDVGANAIRVGGTPGESGPYATDQGYHTIVDNSISDFGVVWPEGAGICVQVSGHNTVMHNEVHDGAYTGISVGMRWDFIASPCMNNTVAYNHVYDVMQRFDDGAGIYMLGSQPGTVVHHNKVHDLPNVASTIYPAGMGGIGLYLDQGSKDIVMEKNWVYRVDWGFQINPAQNCTLRNNVFVDCERVNFVEGNHSLSGDGGNAMLRNVFYGTKYRLLFTRWQAHITASDYNTYYNTAGWNPGADVADWKALGGTFDTHSLEQDPQFADYANDNLSIGNSNVIALGFEAITGMDTVGPRGASSGGNHAPVLQAVGNKSVNEGTPLTFSISATDADSGDTLSYSAQSVPSGATFSGQTFSWTPAHDQSGSYGVTFIVSDGQVQDSEAITITVSDVPSGSPPVLQTIGNRSVNEAALLSFSINATDADGDPLTYGATNLPSGASFVGQTFSWTPNYSQAGSHQVTFTASDWQATDSEVVTVTVNNVNRPPVLASIGNRSVNESALLAFSVTATDPDGQTVSLVAQNLPTGATLSGTAFSWTPSSSQAGTYTTTFVASDGQMSDSETITISVADHDADASSPVVTGCSPAADSIQASVNSLVILHLADSGMGVDADTVNISLDGVTVYSGDVASYSSARGVCRRAGTGADYMYAFQPNSRFDFDELVGVVVNASDLDGNVMTPYSYSFRTEMWSFGANHSVSWGPQDLDKGHPATVCDSGGNIWAVYHAGPVGKRDIYICRRRVTDTSFSGPTQLTTHSGDQSYPDIGIGTDDRLYVVWQDDRRGDWDVYGTTSADGTIWPTAVTRISNSDDHQVAPAIVVDAQSPNAAHVAWQDDGAGHQDIYVASSSNGFGTAPITRVTSNSSDQTAPDIAVDASNVVYVVWTDNRGGSDDIYGACSSYGPWTDTALITGAGNQNAPAIATEATGSRLHFAWVDSISGNGDVWYASSDPMPAIPVTQQNLVDDTVGADQVAPTLVTTGSTGNGLKVFVCWQDWRSYVSGRDTDLYFVQVKTGADTNVLVGDSSTGSNQSDPVLCVDRYGYPYIVWTDNRNIEEGVYFAGASYMDPAAMESQVVTASTGGTVGTASPSTVDDVSVVIPAGASPHDATITITRIQYPPSVPAGTILAYDFGPSGLGFNEAVTVTVPYLLADYPAGDPTPCWYDPQTGGLSQGGMSDIEVLSISGTIGAVRFKATHFTMYGLVDTSAVIGGGDDSGGGGGGCALSPSDSAGLAEFLLPYVLLAIAMAGLRLRDRRARQRVSGASRR